MARLTGSQVKQIQDALLSAYDSREALGMMVRFELDQNLAEITGGETLTAVVFSLIAWAERTGRVGELIAGACRQNPGNEALQVLAQAARSWFPPAAAPGPPATVVAATAHGRGAGAAAPGCDVFISYSHKDGDWVRNVLLPRLETAGLRVCVDFRDFEIGVPSIVNMERAVEQCRRTLLVLTPQWVASEWTAFESLMAQTADPSGLRRRMIPLLREPCTPPPRIAMLTYADFTATDDRVLPWERLVRGLKDG